MERWQTLLIIIGGVTAIIAFHKKIIKPIWAWVKKWDLILKQIYSEFIPDHGKSIYDKITNIEINVGVVKSAQAAIIRLDNLPIIEFNAQGLCTMVNKSWQTLSGMDLTQAKGWGWLDAIHSNGKEKVKEDWLSAISSNSEFNTSYKYINKRTYDIFNVEVICIINRNSKEEVISIIGTVIRLQDDVQTKSEKVEPVKVEIIKVPPKTE